MSSTRHATIDGPFRQERFASSPEFERGLIASMVARRCSALDDAADRELIWFLQYLSHQQGGLNAVAAELLEKFGDRIGTEAMVGIGKRAGQSYTADEVCEIRNDMPYAASCQFPLRGETGRDIAGKLNSFEKRSRRLAHEARLARELTALAEDAFLTASMIEEGRKAELDAENKREREQARSHPTSYPVTAFLDLCIQSATHQPWCPDPALETLENDLRDLCLNPAASLGLKSEGAAPWYFHNLISTLRQYMPRWIAERHTRTVVTALGQKVHDTLDYTQHSRTMTLMVGEARVGKSFSAQSWCEQHPGQARFVEVPPGNDDKTFFRALARGLGLGNFQQYKAGEIRERVESVLLPGDLLLCLDEAHRLWPEVNLWRGFPKRLNWVMSMANHGVPICLIATPQFIERQKTSDQFSGWNSAQFMGRLSHYEPLPRELELADLMAVARSVLPEVDTRTLRALAAYARMSARYLAAIDAIAKRARYIAGRDGRPTATTNDVRTAMQQSVIPADSKLVSALKSVEKPAGRVGRRRIATPLPDAGSGMAEEGQPQESEREIVAGAAREIAPPGLAGCVRSELHPV